MTFCPASERCPGVCLTQDAGDQTWHRVVIGQLRAWSSLAPIPKVWPSMRRPVLQDFSYLSHRAATPDVAGGSGGACGWGEPFGTGVLANPIHGSITQCQRAFLHYPSKKEEAASDTTLVPT
eukprot:29946-Pelagomonas_calceolata.AAC.1